MDFNKLENVVKNYGVYCLIGLIAISVLTILLPLAIAIAPLAGIGYGVTKLVDYLGDLADGTETVRR